MLLHTFHTPALFLPACSTGQAFDAVDTCYVHFKPFPEHVVEQILKEGDCMHCAGSFMVEGPLFAPQVTEFITDKVKVTQAEASRLRFAHSGSSSSLPRF